METAAIALVCERGACRGRCSAPSPTARATAPSTLEVFATSNQDGTPNGAAITAYLEKYPEKIPILVQLGEDATLATERAAAAAIEAAARL